MVSIRSYTTKSGKTLYGVRGYDGINKGTSKQINYHKQGLVRAADARA